MGNDDRDTAIAFLEWYLDYLERYEPGATKTMNHIRETIYALPLDMDDLVDED